MEASELLEQVERYGACLGIEAGRVYVEPRSAIPPDLFRELRNRKTELLTLLRNVDQNGVDAIGELRPNPGAALPHPWLRRVVNSPRGHGRLLWTDGERAAVSTAPNSAWFVDLADVRLPGVE